MPPGQRDKTTGLPIPDPVVPATSICFTIQVPNAIEYRSAFKGALASLGQAWTWQQTAGQDNQAAFDAAELWRARIQAAMYTLDCGEEPMSCADVADCIESDPSVQAAIAAVVPATPIDGLVYPPTVPLTPGQMTARLNEIDDCGFDAFWAQSEQYIDYMVDLGQDVLDQIAVYSAALDAGEQVPMGQFLGKLKNSSTAGKVIDFLQWALTTVKAAYEAADNEANRNALKCAIFCEGKDDCLISIQRTLDVLNERNGGLLTPGDLDDLPSLVDAFLAAAFNPALALDLWLLFLMGTAKTAGMFGLQGIDETLNLVLKIAVNDSNNDWETLCEDCDEPPVEDCYNFTAGEQGWAAWTHPISGLAAATWTAQGWDTGYNAGFSAIQRAFTGTITRVTITLAEPTPTDTNVLVQVLNLALSAGESSNSQGLDVYDFTGLSITDGLYVNVQTDAPWTSTQRIVEICLEFAP